MKPRQSRWLRAVRAAGPRDSLPPARADWLARALSRAGVLSPSECEVAIPEGRVALDGRVVTDPLSLLWEGTRVTLDGAPVDLAFPTHVLAYHKPMGCVVAGADPEGAPTVFSLLQRALTPALARFGWHALGRLDRDTTGLLLFSNDERLVAHFTAPESRLSKRYLAVVRRGVTDAALAALREGVTLDGRPTLPALARARGADAVELTLTEGRHHQVKRMLSAVGLRVSLLHREAVGDVELGVPLGRWRQLTEREVAEGLGFSRPRR